MPRPVPWGCLAPRSLVGSRAAGAGGGTCRGRSRMYTPRPLRTRIPPHGRVPPQLSPRLPRRQGPPLATPHPADGSWYRLHTTLEGGRQGQCAGSTTLDGHGVRPAQLEYRDELGRQPRPVSAHFLCSRQIGQIGQIGQICPSSSRTVACAASATTVSTVVASYGSAKTKRASVSAGPGRAGLPSGRGSPRRARSPTSTTGQALNPGALLWRPSPWSWRGSVRRVPRRSRP